MKITKYEHACVVIETEDKSLVIDPGVFTASLPELNNVAAVVITHVHPDHFDPDRIQAIRNNNPEVVIFSTSEVIKELDGDHIQAVTGGNSGKVGPFKLQFFGGQHAVIHPSYSTNQNVGVLVNDIFYYPGDSFVLPDKAVEILALPINAPWMKISEAMDFAVAIKPRQAFETHNVFLSDAGNDLADRIMSFVESVGTKYTHLKPGESIEI